MNLNVAELDAFNEWLWGTKLDGSDGNLYKYFPTLKDTVKPLMINSEGLVEEAPSAEKYVQGNNYN